MIRKTAIIIGASSEIGLETAKQFAKNGYNLALTYNTNKMDLSEFENVEAKTYKLDLSLNGEVEKFFKSIQSDFKTFDTLVFCAGVAQKRALILDVSNEEIDNLFEINIKSAIKAIREYTKIAVSGKNGNIVLVGSFVEKLGCSCESVYTATKSAMTGLCKSLASELGNLNIRINVVAPGFIDTKMNNNLNNEAKTEIANITPLQRLGNVCDVANAIIFLANENSSFITGQTLFVDGGLVLE